MRRIVSILLALALVLGLSLMATTPAAAAIINVPGTWPTIALAVANSGPNDVIQVMPGIYPEGQIVIPHNLTIEGIGGKPLINPIGSLTGTNAAGAWILVNPGVTFTLKDVVLDGTTFWIHQAVRNHGLTTVDSVDFLNIQGSLSGSPYRGVATQSYGGTVAGGAGSDSHGGGGTASTLTVIGCTFQQIGRIGVVVKGTASTASISGCTYTGKGAIDCLDYAFEAGAGGTMTVTGSTVTACTGVASSDGSTSAGILVTDYWGPGTSATITGNSLTGNTAGIGVGYLPTDASTVTAHFNNMGSNLPYGIDCWSTAITVDGTCNWWGAADGPSTVGPGSGDQVSTNVDYSAWLTEPYAPQKSVAAPGGTASFTPTQGNVEGLTAMAPPATPPVTLPYGMFNFTICCFGGSTATLGVTLPGPVPVGTKWYKYNGGAWDPLPIGSDDGDAFITVTLTDNNPIHDEDPTVGYIVDQGGPGYGGTVGWETYPVNKVRVFLPWIALCAAIAAGVSLVAARRRRAQS